jgi:hypothetical protein
MAPLIFLLALTSSTLVLSNHVNCTSPGCADLCNFHGRWVHDMGVCVCDDMWYTPKIDISHHHSHLSHGDEVNVTECTQRRKWQLTAFTLNMILAPFGVPFTYLGLNGHATAYIILFWLGGILAFLTHILPENANPYAKALGFVPFATWLVWYVLNWILFGVNHYKDENGEELYKW